jgi:hypothetical protein
MAAGHAIDYPVARDALNVSTTTARPGAPVSISGGGFAPGATIQITIASTPTLLSTVNADGSGSFQTTVVLPSSLEPGIHTLSATGANPAGGTLVLSSQITVGSGLAFTGSNSLALAVVAFVGIAVGLLAISVTRRRNANGL